VFPVARQSGGLIGSWDQRVADMAVFGARVTRLSFFFIAVLFHFIEHIQAGSAEFYCGCSLTRHAMPEKPGPSPHWGPQVAVGQCHSVP
jgi:hypothetical protein